MLKQLQAAPFCVVTHHLASKQTCYSPKRLLGGLVGRTGG